MKLLKKIKKYSYKFMIIEVKILYNHFLYKFRWILFIIQRYKRMKIVIVFNFLINNLLIYKGNKDDYLNLIFNNRIYVIIYLFVHFLVINLNLLKLNLIYY
jgi:hypothetical protein